MPYSMNFILADYSNTAVELFIKRLIAFYQVVSEDGVNKRLETVSDSHEATRPETLCFIEGRDASEQRCNYGTTYVDAFTACFAGKAHFTGGNQQFTVCYKKKKKKKIKKKKKKKKNLELPRGTQIVITEGQIVKLTKK
jgi:hypothetical protein